MAIRKVKPDDMKAIVILLEQHRISGNGKFYERKAQRLIDDSCILAVMSIHFISQLALQGDFAGISYFLVDESTRSLGIGWLMEDYCMQIAKEKNVIELKCIAMKDELMHIVFISDRVTKKYLNI